MKTIKIADREIAVRPSAYTPVLFKRMTGKDLMQTLADKEIPTLEKTEIFMQLFYIMNMQATTLDIQQELEKAEDEKAFFTFLDQLDSEAIYSEETLTQIIAVYAKSNKTTSTAKN